MQDVPNIQYPRHKLGILCEHSVGDKVKIKPVDMTGQVTSIQCNWPGHVVYLVAYWANSARHEEWMQPGELEAIGGR